MSRPLPLIEFAQSIKKNTADLTVNDLTAFMKWWMKQKPRKDILNMAGKYKMGQYKDAQTSRLSSDKVIDVEQADDGVAEEMADEYMKENANENEVVCEVGFTQADIDAVVWGLRELLTTYDFEGNSMGERLQGLFDSLEALETKYE